MGHLCAVGVLANAGEAQTAVVRCCAGEERNWLSCCSCAMSRSHCSLDIKAAVDEETATVDGSAVETCDTDGGIAKCDRCHTAARCGEHGRAPSQCQPGSYVGIDSCGSGVVKKHQNKSKLFKKSTKKPGLFSS